MEKSKAYLDTLQSIDRLDRCNNDEDDMIAKFKVGQKIFLELEITDEKIAQMLYFWLYSKSKVDNESRLEIFGARLDGIHYDLENETIKKYLKNQISILERNDN